ncbi:MAG: DEAD/DEAH box helicase [Lamprobacter sp.]|uniref:DEAD/DEAH box helicase n=1 Tax=Lamprobacter sp. TaxID=3100796 RepID=UPI002B25F4D9|nr:DEAD/DEAH box helicase [Lamprobacter sp.]MEA3638832.1 DEAD/DEAH box helicase [Lamprobacter sp.]
MLFTEQQLEHELPAAYVDRGRRYVEDGHVLSVDQRADKGVISGRVRGSGTRVYQVVVQIDARVGSGSNIRGHCSCPVGFNCKHVAALLLAADEAIDGGRQAPSPRRLQPTPPRQVLPASVASWLFETEQLDIDEDDQQWLLYLLRLQTPALSHAKVILSAAKVRRLKSGGYGKPAPFNLRAQSKGRFIRAEDRRIIALSAAQPSGGEFGAAVLSDDLGIELLEAVLRSGRGHWRDKDGPRLMRGNPVAGELSWCWQEDSQLHLRFNTEREGLVLLPLHPPWYLDPASGECGPIETPLGEREATALVRAPAIPLASLDAFEEQTRTRFKGLKLPSPPHPKHRRVSIDAPTPSLRLLSREIPGVSSYSAWAYGAAAEPRWEDEARLRLDYAGAMIDPREAGDHVSHLKDGVVIECDRQPQAEQAALKRLEMLGLEQKVETSEGVGVPFGPPRVEAWLAFMDRDLPLLEGEGWRVEVDPSFRFRVGRVGDWDLDIEEGDAGRWLDLSLGVEVDGERLDLLPILLNLIQNPNVDLSLEALNALNDETRFSLRLEDGRYIFFQADRLKPILSTLVELYDPMARLQGDGRMRLSRLQATELAELEQQAPNLSWRGGEQAREWGRRLREFERIERVEPPDELKAELRSYQQEGLNWLQFLRDFELGGVLADDMGLGKTIQALAHLLIEKAAGRADRPSLVVAPTSLMFNWKRETERFAPSLRVVILQGPKRQAHFDTLAEQDLVLTTYALLPRDLEVISAQPWHLLILDEAQAIKNPRSKVAQAARSLEARHRLCLTGTPLENHLGELWALLDFLMPDLLGDERGFRRLFRNPIERHGDQDRTERLRRRVAPFLLRRTKEQVAAELPPKTEILREIPLATDQRDLYETLRLALHEKVREEIKRKGLAQSGIIILDALLKLRQCCCDPRLVSLESARHVKGSAKLDLLIELLADLMEEGRRILLFSQFTSMLSLIEEALDKRLKQKKDRDYVKLTGQTRDRQTPVDRFQAGEVPLFLISLKAGGSGLNLTAADTVIHYDPWWNPAAERQATDRAHRIGQDKPVFVYKLLTEGTVEQRVAELQARKQALADAMLEGGGSATKSLSHEDLELLFAPLDAD